MTIRADASYLRLPYIRENYEELIKEAKINDLGYEQFLQLMLERETQLRRHNSIQHKIKAAHFPNLITLDDFKRDHLAIDIRQTINELETMAFLEKGQNIILVGNPGTGKTALSIALGMKACMMGKSVQFISVPNLLIELKEAMSENQITRYKQRFDNYDLVILDEWGYCTFNQQAGEILFNLVSGRNEKGPIILTSNLPVDQWNSIFHDEVLTGAIVDRLTNMAYLMDMTGQSYRFLQTKDWMESRKKDESRFS